MHIVKPRTRKNSKSGSLYESFNGKLRDELLNTEIFYTLKEAEILIEQWRVHYNEVRPHSSLGYRPPVPKAAGSDNKTKEYYQTIISTH